MQLEALCRMDFLERIGLKATNFWTIIIFNALMYIGMTIIVIMIIIQEHSHIDTIRTYRAVIELLLCLAIFITGILLIRTVKSFYNVVPNMLIFWLVVGSLTSLVKCIEQVLFLYYDSTEAWFFVLLFFLYNVDDIFPALVFLRTFDVYSKFFTNQVSLSDDDISIMNMIGNSQQD